jgi:N6-adenosine-specific RNA methylase IME4
MTPYRVIVADPPWSYLIHPLTDEQRAERLNHDRDGNPSARRRGAPADLHYSTMTHAEVAALPIGEQAADDAFLFLWVTNPRLFFDKAGNGPSPAEMMAGWGFEYTTMLTWHKLGAPGLGWYFRGDTEHVLFGVRGKARIPTALRVSNHFAARKGRHSAKPDRFYEIVERVSPGPYLEMFARRRRYGWDVWGNEAPEDAASQAEMGLVG